MLILGVGLLLHVARLALILDRITHHPVHAEASGSSILGSSAVLMNPVWDHVEGYEMSQEETDAKNRIAVAKMGFTEEPLPSKQSKRSEWAQTTCRWTFK